MRKEDPEFEAQVRIVEAEQRSYTGLVSRVKYVLEPFYTNPDTAIVSSLQKVIEKVRGKPAKLSVWIFATDGGPFAEAGIPTVGFGPEEERFTHSALEHVRVEDIMTAAKVYCGLALESS